MISAYMTIIMTTLDHKRYKNVQILLNSMLRDVNGLLIK